MTGHLHPLNQFMRKSLKYFTDLGFQIVEGPEIETEWYNFDALNMPVTHPSRDVQDTFWLAPRSPQGEVGAKDLPAEALAKEGGRVLRTHTTATDVREIRKKNLKPPLKLIIPGRCFRHEATDLTHEHTFYQIDGIAIDKDLNMGHLIGLLDRFMRELFGKELKTRVRPGYFPFVEPGMEMDIFVKSQNPNLKSQNGKWQEMLGAGMGHPQVLKNIGLDSNKWQAIMWGMGIDRYMMEYFGVDDIRLSYSGDLRFLKQF